MSGDKSQNEKYLSSYNPTIYLNKMISLINDFNTPRQYILWYLKRLWITKVTFPILSYKANNMMEGTAKTIYKQPNLIIYFLTRYIVYLNEYCQEFNIQPNDLIDSIFPENTITLEANYEGSAEKNDISVTEYTLVVRAPLYVSVYTRDPYYSITSIHVNITHMDYSIRQIVYDCMDESEYRTAKVIYNKEFALDRDGELKNSNYAISNRLYEDDMMIYRTMISQLLIFMGGIIESTLSIVQIKAVPK